MSTPIKIGISACILGERVRYNNCSEKDPYITEVLAKYVEFIPICPEMACGLGVPREEMRQVDCNGEIRLIASESGEDWSDRMIMWSDKIFPGLDEEGLNGFILRSKSPSCALRKARIYMTNGRPNRFGAGFFAERLSQAFPLLPLESNDRLYNPLIRENFIRRVFILKRWKDLLAKGMEIGNLVDFHDRHKMIVRAHDIRGYRQLGKLLGESTIFNTDEIFGAYGNMLFRSLALKATPRKNAEVLKYAAGFFKKDLDVDDNRELMSKIYGYKNGKLPLTMPVTLINFFARKYDKPYLQQQYFFNPDEAELRLLNHI